MPQPHEIQEGLRFDSLASQYDASDDVYPLRTEIRNHTVSIVGDLNPGVVLDAGCGTGRALIDLAANIEHGIGIDISQAMIRVARASAEKSGCTNLQFIHASLLDLADNLVANEELKIPDVITSTYSMHHLSREEKQRIIGAFAAILPPTAAIVIGDLMFSGNPAEHASDYDLVGYNPETDTPETVEVMGEMLENCGFTVTTNPLHPLAGVMVAQRYARRDT